MNGYGRDMIQPPVTGQTLPSWMQNIISNPLAGLPPSQQQQPQAGFPPPLNLTPPNPTQPQQPPQGGGGQMLLSGLAKLASMGGAPGLGQGFTDFGNDAASGGLGGAAIGLGKRMFNSLSPGGNLSGIY